MNGTKPRAQSPPNISARSIQNTPPNTVPQYYHEQIPINPYPQPVFMSNYYQPITNIDMSKQAMSLHTGINYGYVPTRQNYPMLQPPQSRPRIGPPTATINQIQSLYQSAVPSVISNAGSSGQFVLNGTVPYTGYVQQPNYQRVVPLMVNQPNPFLPQPSQQAFYSQQSAPQWYGQSMPTQQTGAQQTHIPQTQQPRVSKRASHAVEIVDPGTNKPIVIDNPTAGKESTPPQSSVDSSARHTPSSIEQSLVPSPANSNVAAEFATKVAIALGPVKPQLSERDEDVIDDVGHHQVYADDVADFVPPSSTVLPEQIAYTEPPGQLMYEKPYSMDIDDSIQQENLEPTTSENFIETNPPVVECEVSPQYENDVLREQDAVSFSSVTSIDSIGASGPPDITLTSTVELPVSSSLSEVEPNNEASPAPQQPQIETYVDLQIAADLRQVTIDQDEIANVPSIHTTEPESIAIVKPPKPVKQEQRFETNRSDMKTDPGKPSSTTKTSTKASKNQVSSGKIEKTSAKSSSASSKKDKVAPSTAKSDKSKEKKSNQQTKAQKDKAILKQTDSIEKRSDISPENEQFFPAEDRLDTPDDVVRPIPVVIGNRPDAPIIYGGDEYYLTSPNTDGADLSIEFDYTLPSSSYSQVDEISAVDKQDGDSGKQKSKVKDLVIHDLPKPTEDIVSIPDEISNQPTTDIAERRIADSTHTAIDTHSPSPPPLVSARSESPNQSTDSTADTVNQITNDTVSLQPKPSVENEKQKNNKDKNDIPRDNTISKVSPIRTPPSEKEPITTTEREVSTPSPAPLPTLKYNYKEDQWSPLNPEGKKQYDRNFLLALQFSDEALTKPQNLPKMEIILDSVVVPKDHQSGTHSPPLFSSHHDPTSPFSRQYSRGDRRGSREQQLRKHGSHPPQQIIAAIPADVKLNTVENAWKPSHKGDKIEDPYEAETAKICKKVRSILNKLTPQKFETLVDQVAALNVSDEKRLKCVVELIFEKAIDEPSFSVAYANMCKKLSVDGFKSKIPKSTFRLILLSSCQHEYELDRKSEMDIENREAEITNAATEALKNQLREELSLEQAKIKRRTLGNIRFIGELYKLNMLNDNVMHGCLNGLLSTHVHDEEKLECLCRLMKTIGKELDNNKAKQDAMNSYFHSMQKIINARKISSRIRFMLQDTIELRQNKWIPRREENNPKTIDEVHQEMKKEEARKLIQQQNIKHTTKPLRPTNQGHSGSNEWQSVPKPRPTTFKLSKMAVRDSPHSVMLGPGPGFSSWSQGATSNKNQDYDKPADRNRFNVLNSDDDFKSRSMVRSPARGDSRSMGQTFSRDSHSREGQGRNRPPRAAGARASIEKERGNFSAGIKPLRPNTPSQQSSSSNASRESSSSRVPSAGSEMSAQTVARKCDEMIAEYLSSHELVETIHLVRELNPLHIYLVVSTSINKVIERSTMARQQIVKLLQALVHQNILPISAYIAGLNEVMNDALDLAVDAPKIWEYLGEIIGPMVLMGAILIAELRDTILLAQHKAGSLMSEILKFCAQEKGQDAVAKIWVDSRLNWQDLLPPNTTVQEFLKLQKLEFTVTDHQMSPSKFDLDTVRHGLRHQLANQAVDDIITWIEENVDPASQADLQFIRLLITEVCRRSIIQNDNGYLHVSKDTFMQRDFRVIITKYLDQNAEAELHSLLAVQVLAASLSYPPGLLQSFFDLFYDMDIISEDAFKTWEVSTEEPETKGVSLTQLRQFFVSLNDNVTS